MPTRDVRDEVLDAARSCFERFGIRKTTMEDIAKASDISRKTLYRLFSNKGALLAHFIEHESRQACLAAQATLDMTLPADLLVAVAEDALLKQASTMATMRLFIEEDQLAETLNALYQSRSRAEVLGEFWKPILDRAENDGALRSDLGRNEILQWIFFIHSSLLTGPNLWSGALGGRSRLDFLRLFLSQSILKPMFYS